MESLEGSAMKAVRGHDGQPKVVDVDEAPGRGEVIAMRSVGICASDLRYLAGGTEKILGHELAGVRQDGTPVSVEGLFGCGECSYCLEGRNNLCHQATKMALGIMQDGVIQRNLVRVRSPRTRQDGGIPRCHHRSKPSDRPTPENGLGQGMTCQEIDSDVEGTG